MIVVARRIPRARLYSSDPRSSVFPLINTSTSGAAVSIATLRSSSPRSFARTSERLKSKCKGATRSRLASATRRAASASRMLSARAARPIESRRAVSALAAASALLRAIAAVSIVAVCGTVAAAGV